MNEMCFNCNFKSKAAEKLEFNGLFQLSCNTLSKSFNKGNSIIKQGQQFSKILYLQKGLVKINVDGPHYSQIIKILKAPCYLGLPTSMGDKINQYSITSLSTTNVCFIDFGTFLNLMNNNISFAHEIIVEICNNELEFTRKFVNRSQKQTRGRIAEMILDFANNIFENDSFKLPITQKELSNYIDCSRENLNRILSEFQKDKLINFKGKSIEILNKNHLELISKNG